MKKIVPFLSVLWFAGCNQLADVEPKISFVPPVYVQELPSKEPSDTLLQNRGSLFAQAGANALFTDNKAKKINDLITVLIQEQNNISFNDSKSLSTTTNANLGGGQLTYTGTDTPNPIVNEVNALGNHNFDTTSNRSFSGSGSKTKTDSFSSKITARIVKVLENGNYFISGRKEVLVDGEKQILQISGVVNPKNISSSNEVLSVYLADAKILYEGQGDLKQSTTQGKVTKAAGALWPF